MSASPLYWRAIVVCLEVASALLVWARGEFKDRW